MYRQPSGKITGVPADFQFLKFCHRPCREVWWLHPSMTPQVHQYCCSCLPDTPNTAGPIISVSAGLSRMTCVETREIKKIMALGRIPSGREGREGASLWDKVERLPLPRDNVWNEGYVPSSSLAPSTSEEVRACDH
jgi:hypothetical protein